MINKDNLEEEKVFWTGNNIHHLKRHHKYLLILVSISIPLFIYRIIEEIIEGSSFVYWTIYLLMMILIIYAVSLDKPEENFTTYTITELQLTIETEDYELKFDIQDINRYLLWRKSYGGKAVLYMKSNITKKIIKTNDINALEEVLNRLLPEKLSK